MEEKESGDNYEKKKHSVKGTWDNSLQPIIIRRMHLESRNFDK